ncbi:MAG: FAD-dependent oxidoreductase [Alphaproteobacteria bacterium]|nr:FAD-dependent oxidoreductase [Alphaproteobacteria bacterium]
MTIYIIGGGIAGLSAAYYAQEKGFSVSLFEASNHLGGRCFSFFDKELNTEIDNGTHFISGANFNFFKLISNCHFSPNLSDLGTTFDFYDKNANKFSIDLNSPLSLIKNWKKISYNLIASILNTTPNHADKRLFFKTLTKCFFSKNKHLYTAQNSLKEDIVIPIQSFLENKIDIHLSKQVLFFNERQIKLRNATIQLKNDDFIISTIQPVNTKFETILNLYLKTDIKLPNQAKVVGLSQCTGHWIIQKENMLSVVISAADRLKNTDIAPQIWEELSTILSTKTKLPPHKIVKNYRATIEQTKRAIRPHQKFGKIIYAGDYVSTGLPCTIEGAILSGENAINLINNFWENYSQC